MSTYLQSSAVTAAKKKTQEHEAKRPVYVSRWEQEMDDALQQMENRRFSYDVEADPVYGSYRRAYTRKGKLAMEDTLGKTTALTGGYGNSWAATAAQDSYNGYMQSLTDKIPQLYQLAQSRFDQETKQLNEQYDHYLRQELADRESFDDAFDRWLKELQLLQDQEQAISKEDFDRFEANREWNAKHPNSTGNDTTDGSATGLPPVGSWDNGDVSEENIKKIQAVLGVTVDGKWGRESYIAAGHVDANTAWNNYTSEFGLE